MFLRPGLLLDRCANPSWQQRSADGHAGVRGERAAALGDVPGLLLGIHSGRLDIATRDQIEDEALRLNTDWYADVLRALTNE
jgi:hypothetical protein